MKQIVGSFEKKKKKWKEAKKNAPELKINKIKKK